MELPEGWRQDLTSFEGIWPDHEPALIAFLAVSNQWRIASHGLQGSRYIGLDYKAVHAGLDLAGITVTPEVWADLRLIEAGATQALNGD